MVDPDLVYATRQKLTNGLAQLPPIATVKIISDFPLQIEGNLDDDARFYFRARMGLAELRVARRGFNPLDPTATIMLVDYDRRVDPTDAAEAVALFKALLVKHGRMDAMTAQQAGTHITHCCVRHGCKYGDRTCPVTLRQRPQRYPCEFCEDDPPSRVVLTIEGSTATTDSASGQALALTVDGNALRDEVDGEYVTLHSWNASGHHTALRPLAGRRLRITVALADDCPRCGQPLDARPATSRTDNKTPICVSCGTDEGLRELNMEALPPKECWPVYGDKDEGSAVITLDSITRELLPELGGDYDHVLGLVKQQALLADTLIQGGLPTGLSGVEVVDEEVAAFVRAKIRSERVYDDIQRAKQTEGEA